MLKGLNHITLAVSDLQVSLDFYQSLLGFTGHVKWDKGAYLTLGELWLCLALGNVDDKSDYSHIAFSIEQESFEGLSRQLNAAGVKQWKINHSEGSSLYILDPDGHRLELHVGDLASRLENLKTKPYQGMQWL